MTDLRTAAQQALEALYEETAWFGPTPKGAAAITALRAALAQQAEPVAWEGWWLHHGQHNYRAKPLTSERVKELMKLAFEVGQEAAPPQRKPLTEEEIDALPWNGSPRQFARAVEQAHGIKE